MKLSMLCMAMLTLMACGGLALAVERTLTIKDNVGRQWENEPVNWQLTFDAGEWDGAGFVVLRDGKPITGQARVDEKHDDGSVRHAVVRFIIDSLTEDASTTLIFNTNQAGLKEAGVWLEHGDNFQSITNGYTGVKLLDAGDGGQPHEHLGPILGVRLPSGAYVGSSGYSCETAQPVESQFELLEEGPVYIAARVTTTFDNGRTHALTAALWKGSRSIDIEEEFDIGPDDKYKFKQYEDDKDELAWEWWQWYGDRLGTEQTHPNYFVFTLTPEPGRQDVHFTPQLVRYGGEHSSTDARKKDDGEGYPLTYAREAYLEKYLVGRSQWRPDGVQWYLAAVDASADAEAVGLYTHSVRNWRNPNVFPLPEGITLRTGANDMRIISKSDRSLNVYAPIGLGRRTWAIRPSTYGESMTARGTSPDALSAEKLQRSFGLDITRKWLTEWQMEDNYPRLFVRPGEEAAYYDRLRQASQGGSELLEFLRRQDRESFDRAYRRAVDAADRMINGYLVAGMPSSYPGWMLGYWHGIDFATHLDNLAGSQFCTPEMRRELRKKLAILTYCLTSRDAWQDKQINYGWGSMNMPVGRWGGLVVMASAISDHPQAEVWLKDASRYFGVLLDTEYAPCGTHISCPHYIGASSTTFYAWQIMANSGIGEDVSESPQLKNFARYYMQLMKPIDPRWGIRILLNEGDTRPGSTAMPAILAALFRESDPELAGQLMTVWREGGSVTGGGMGVPTEIVIDRTIDPRPLKLRSEVFPGFGAILRNRELGTAQESYVAFVGGDFMIDHTNTDQLAFAWNEKGVPLTVFCGSMYVPMAATALSQNTVAWDVRPGGDPGPGRDTPGNWYHDNNQAYVDLGGVTPTLHWEIAWSTEVVGSKITDARGMVTLAREAPGAALLEGQVDITALAERPTRHTNYEAALAPHAAPPTVPLEQPFTWTRRLLNVTAPRAEGMNYIVVRDDFGGFSERTPNFNYWSLSDSVQFNGNLARFAGQLGVDTDMVVLAPSEFTLHTGRFTHTNCEPIVAHLHRQRYGEAFSETTVLCRVEGQKDEGFFVVLFPYAADEQKPRVEPWLDGAGAKISWKGEIHYVLLDVNEHEVDADGIQARASALVVKVHEAGDAASLLLLDGVEARFGGMEISRNDAPSGIQQRGRERMVEPARNLLPEQD